MSTVAPAMLSILMPVYNERATVDRAIEEVLGADLPLPFELIVVDDGSTDGTSEIRSGRQWDGRVRLIAHEHNKGMSAPVRTALKVRMGECSAIFNAVL